MQFHNLGKIKQISLLMYQKLNSRSLFTLIYAQSHREALDLSDIVLQTMEEATVLVTKFCKCDILTVFALGLFHPDFHGKHGKLKNLMCALGF